MPRIPRRWHWAEEACFHLMNRGQYREAVFADDEDRAAFLGLATAIGNASSCAFITIA